MPRYARQVAESHIYHIMTRGNERKNIFLDKNDKIAFLKRLLKVKVEKKFFLYAYCLMNNHVHLLIKETDEELSRIMASLNTSYAAYFNKKYERVGHLFQDRYRSETINNEEHLLSAVRYIHNNPVKAKIVSHPQSYMWSSYRFYFFSEKYQCGLVDKEFILQFFSIQSESALKLFAEFHSQPNEDRILDCDKHEIDAVVKKYVAEYLASKHQTLAWLKQKENISQRNELIRLLKKKCFPIRKIAEILDIGRNIVQRVK